MSTNNNHAHLISLLAGSTAGLSVDLALFPIDTIKTRLQSFHNNVQRTPGSLRLFAGFPAVAIGSAPAAFCKPYAAAAFFLTYEAVKDACRDLSTHPISHSVLSACIAEIVACIIRVPCEVVKQRTQNQPVHGVSTVFLQTLRNEGIRGFYRGYVSTLSREIPFSLIQYPIWEKLKYMTIEWNRNSIGTDDITDPTASQLRAWQSAMCGCLAGTIAGAVTTPLDVAKTRIMLAEPNSNFASGHIIYAMRTIFQESGIYGLFSGLIPRITLLSVGGAIFLGIYDISTRFWTLIVQNSKD